MSDASTLRANLAKLALQEGGWGYVPEQPAHLEPTCLALLALQAERESYLTVMERGLDFLRRSTSADGAVRLSRGRDEAVWPTGITLFTRLVLGESAVDLQPSISALLGVRGRTTEPKDDEAGDIDSLIVGWPWGDGNFSWVEPTSWATLSLTRAGLESHPRVVEGVKFLLDRTFEGGGLNYGNRRIFGIDLEAIPTPTALSLLALQRQGQEPRVQSSVAYLCRQAEGGTEGRTAPGS